MLRCYQSFRDETQALPRIAHTAEPDMKYEISVKSTPSQRIAAVRARVPISGISQAWKPALDQVWAFLKTNSALRPGHNLFLYHHPQNRNDAMDIDFGVQVALPFEAHGKIHCVETPAG